MTSITIRNLGPALKERSRVRAAEHGHSKEAEVGRILQTALSTPVWPPGGNLHVRVLCAPLEGVNLHLPPREPARATRVASIDGPARYQWTVGDAERCREGTGKLRPNAVTAGSMRNSSNDHRLIDAVSLLIAPSSARSTNFQQ